jgi:hypothetical protein
VFSSLVELPTRWWAIHCWGLALLYPVFVIESLAHAIHQRRFRPQALVYWLLPPLRMGARDHVDGQSIWLPRIGWARVDRTLRRRVEKSASLPMLVIALMVLPLLGTEYYLWSREIVPDLRLAIFLKFCESAIWLAFTVEFILMFSISDKKLRYCKDHWLDMAIILLPLAGFLRVLRLGQVWRLHQLTRLGRVYRLRGLSTRLFRGLVVLEVADRVALRDPRKRLAMLQAAYEEKRHELDELSAEIAAVEQQIADKNRVPPA